ncbi:Hypothetical predicted protein [Cloeon dipterum]|uniref:Uncharacterized protein n=1 Tax=Cloeon dipterum TaxID=197152 RepID=A0A8S1ECP6_9INSE|nr:Hypothetical predicted protein [Cloeon dipterum]
MTGFKFLLFTNHFVKQSGQQRTEKEIHSSKQQLMSKSPYYCGQPTYLRYSCLNWSDMRAPQYYNLFGNSQDLAINQTSPQQNSGNAASTPNPQHVGQNEATTSHGTSASSGPAVSPMHTDNDATGFCLMCETFVDNIDQHWSDWHGRYGVEPNDCYVVAEFKSKRMLFCNGTDLENELQECPSCVKVLYIHRFINHHCPVLNQLSGRSLDREKPNRTWGYCLMCKFNFEDLINHRALLHENNYNIYSTRMIFGKWTLLPKKTLENQELTLCSCCRMPIYKYQDGIHLCL